MSNDTALPHSYVMALYESYGEMSAACESVKTAVRADAALYPVYVPTFGEDESEKTSNAAREAAIKSITQLFILDDGETVPEAGILCASPETVKTVEKLNDTKDKFKKAVMAIRNYQKKNKQAQSNISKLIRDEVTQRGYRTDELKLAMETARISSLELKRCYAQIRVMPAELDVFSWTWATNHSRIKKVSVQGAQELIDALPEAKSEAAETARSLLEQCRPDEMLARKIKLPHQLRANYAYLSEGKVVRKLCPISGIVIAQQKNMPRKLWRDKPGNNPERLPRASGIEQKEFIKVLGLHRYAKTPI
ncbi:hypothetical protein QL995_20995 [Pseudoalteromonas sp. APC 3358]|uniref:hypothetical protein n=1 Tax=Pseudoalteromonas sp. APC 3358 TaxID=3035176 RepID=UPI0025B6218F|nr:hypothetical protein [Pseudoalteromonas sp. APC 3358]MDN3385106.1 hypothetical protein [Pseudoalteromonas sp. APC 3358]